MKLIFLSLTTPEEAIARVAMRLRPGGHDVPQETTRRRYAGGRRNFRDVYRHRVDYWQWFDNSGDTPDIERRKWRRMNEPRVSKLPDSDMQGALAALLRAARKAREIARQTGTAIVVMRDGKLCDEIPAAGFMIRKSELPSFGSNSGESGNLDLENEPNAPRSPL